MAISAEFTDFRYRPGSSVN